MTDRLKMLSSFIICSLLFAGCGSSKKPKINEPEKKNSTEPGIIPSEPVNPSNAGTPPEVIAPGDLTEEKPEETLPGETEEKQTPESTDPTAVTPQSGGSGIDLSTLNSNPIGGLLSLVQNPQGAMQAILSSLIKIASGASGGGNTGALISSLLGGTPSTTPESLAPETTNKPNPPADAPTSTPTPVPIPTSTTKPITQPAGG